MNPIKTKKYKSKKRSRDGDAFYNSPYMRIRFYWLPKIRWYLTGMFIWDELYSYYYLNIKKGEQYWLDADSEHCKHIYCRYCGKGQKKQKAIEKYDNP